MLNAYRHSRCPAAWQTQPAQFICLRSENPRNKFTKSLVKVTTSVTALYELIIYIYIILLFKADNVFFKPHFISEKLWRVALPNSNIVSVPQIQTQLNPSSFVADAGMQTYCLNRFVPLCQTWDLATWLFQYNAIKNSKRASKGYITSSF